MKRILHETGADSYKMYIGGSENFRKQIDSSYKANRDDKPKPAWLQDVRAYLVTEWKAEITENIEADDALGIAQDKSFVDVLCWSDVRQQEIKVRKWSNTTVICSIDKDLHMIPGAHYNFVKQEWKFVTDNYAIKWFYQQLIQGDSTDNIMGFDGRARPKIPQFLQPKIDELWACETELEMYDLVWQMYSDYDGQDSSERLEQTAQLLWIRRKENDKWAVPVNTNTSTDPT